VAIGLGSMIGAGIFSAFAPAAEAAGAGLLLGLALAGFVAWCNATSSAQLAAQYPSSGGSYVYGRHRLGAWAGFVAGWGFVVGKTASCAAMALTFATYAAPTTGWVQRLVGVAAVAALTVTNLRGITRTARLTRVIVAITLTVLVGWVVVVLTVGHPQAQHLHLTGLSVHGVLQSAGLLFFAFAGYARIATLGEEVVEPERTIPRAVVIALAVAFLVYAVVAAAGLATVGASGLAATTTPLSHATTVLGASWASPVVRAGAAVASLGSLLALLAGVGRTGLAMAREGDLPRSLASVDPVRQVPDRIQLALAGVVVVLVLVTDLREVIGFSSFGVLVYYAVANAAAYTQDTAHRRWPRPVQLLGLAGCLLLAVTLPVSSVVAGLAVFAVGLVGRALVRRRGRPRV
jgi:APA family basic amino acid/polyamine antiporter